MIGKVKILLNLMVLVLIATTVSAQQPFSATDVLNVKSCSNVQISAEGNMAIYLLSRNRSVTEEPGSAYRELFLLNIAKKESQPLLSGDIRISSPQWHPNNKEVSFLEKRGDNEYTQVWNISMDGGEPKQITNHGSSVLSFTWHPRGEKLFFTAQTPVSEREQQLKKKGFGFTFYEENLKHRNLYVLDIQSGSLEQLTRDMTVWDFELDPSGRQIIMSVSPQNLVDHRYMFRKLHTLDLATGKITLLADREGKLGNYSFSPDSKWIVFNAALEQKDHQISQAFLVRSAGDEIKNLTPEKFRGHIKKVAWKNNNEVLYIAEEGIWTTLNTVNINTGERQVIYDSENSGVNMSSVSFTKDFNQVIISGTSAQIPEDIYTWDGKGHLEKITDLNPWIKERKLGKQEGYRYKARDGQEIEGVIIYPLNFDVKIKYPLIIYVHGGPEHHNLNTWLTGYSRPGQTLAGKGYVVFFPNYRSSTGYGTDFSLVGFHDPAGIEFDDIADAIDHFVDAGFVDKDRVGVAGGSYGGYAAAWFSSFYSEKVKAVSMFAGVSDLISKRGTTDITYEELYVHSGKKLENMWELSLERSPIYWAHQSKTAVFISCGQEDTRVHPGQSLEYYYRLKMNNHPAVRLVTYPGEAHGLSKQTSQNDFLYRHLAWLDWYVKDGKPIDGDMPPLDISDWYGLELE